jgi:hypothetical protein
VNRMDDLDRIYRRLVHNLRTKYPQLLSASFSAEELYQVVVPYRHNRQELGIDTNQDYEMALMRLLSGERGYLVADRDVREALTREIESSNPDTSLFRAFNDRMVSLSSDALAIADPASVRSDDARIAPPAPLDSRMPSAARQSATSGAATPTAPPARRGGLGIPPSPSVSAAIPVAGMPLPPSPGPSRGSVGGGAGFAPAPDALTPARPVAPIRLAPSNAPTTSNPASGKAIGLTGHGNTVPATGSPSARGFSNPPGMDMASPRRSITASAVGGRCRYCSGTLPDGRQITFCPHCGQDLTVQQCPACSTELELGWKFCTTCGRGVAQS